MKFLLTLLFLIPGPAFCQHTDSVRKGKISVGIIFSPDYCYRTLKFEESSRWIADPRNERESPRLSFTTGLSLLWQLHKKLALETGLQFSDKGYQYNSEGSNPSFKATIKYHEQYLDIPLKANYYLLTKKLKLYVSAGFSAGIFLGEKRVSITEIDGHTTKSKVTHNPGISKVNMAMIAGLGIQYDLNNRLTIRLEPVYRRSIHSIIDAPIKEYLYCGGIIAGVYYRL